MSYLKNLLRIYHLCRNTLLKKPKAILVDLTSNCNSDCVFCSTNKNLQVLSLFEWKKLINQIKEWFGTVFIGFSGGEPLLNKDWYGILEYAINKGLIVNLSTNGSLIDKDASRKIMGVGLSDVCISIYGSKETQNRLSNSQNYDKIINGVRNLVKAKEELSSNTKILVRVIINSQNLTEMDDIISTIKKEKFDGVIFRPLYRMDHLLKKYDYHNLWVKDKQKLSKAIKSIILLKKSGFYVVNSYNSINEMYNYYISYEKLQTLRKKPCVLPFRLLIVYCDGTVRSCCRVLGSIKNTSIKKLFYLNRNNLKKDSYLCKQVKIVESTEEFSIKRQLMKLARILSL